ncbi:MobA/MobL family protein [Mesorhizobium sp.]|uniref:MobA/MobL family protein n=1 Tax=Mesorhizobium sp. TaxID=1871066 RepID=UPI0025DAEDA5|nr:MobA/MobL family protein [Mesorhizobium sp.]
MATSLPPDAAIFNARVSVFQRSAGRSAVAAAAYRSASRLVDERIGEVFDYRKKKTEDSFILAPPDAPAWAYDRAQLWNRVEAAEKRKDAVVAREVLITIPRDIPEEDRRAFAEATVVPYVAAGAVVDVAIHCPADVYGEEQPHIHAMIAPRCLDASQQSGFAKTRNAALTSMFESGGRHGGERGDALKAERERIASLMNAFLEAAGSGRRADHRSNAARGLDRDPEPTMGESRLATVKKRKRHDRRTSLVAGIRNTRILENQLFETEEEVMATNATRQARGGIRPRSRIDYKTRLLKERFPDLQNAEGWAAGLHFIDASVPGAVRIATKDGGHLEIRGRLAKVYGQRGQADALAAALRAADDLDDIERLEQLKSLRRKGNGARPRRNPEEAPQLPPDRVESLADRWRSRGYHQITEAPDGVWITIGKCRLQDLGDELRIHGPAASDAAVRAMISKAVDEWDSSLEVFGERAFKDQAWLEAQRQGVVVYDQDTGQLYEPSEDIRKAFEGDQHRIRAEHDEMTAIRNHKAVASLVLEAAAGDDDALKRLRANDRDLADFITLHLDDEQRGKLVGKPEADVVAALPAFRGYGKTAREAEEARRKAEGFPSLADDMEALPPVPGDGYEERRPS